MSYDTVSSSSGGLSLVAIDAIAITISITSVAVFGLIVFCCVRQRKRKRLARSKASFPNSHLQNPSGSMQQQQQGVPLKAFGGYQTVPQQEQQPPYTVHPFPPQQQASTGYFSSPGAPSTTAISPMQPGTSQFSPTVTEVDGTMGNPGIPVNGGHGGPIEIDGTIGNPGVPTGGHGITQQMQPGGSPSAAEIDGRMKVGGQDLGPARIP
jgi:hypothetical protein